jgi:hypothetical protein
MVSATMTGQDKVNALLQVAFAPQAARALSRSANSAKTAMARAVADALNARSTDIKRYIFTTAATPTQLQARVYPVGKRGIPFIKLGAKQGAKRSGGGVTVNVGTRRYLSAFIATMPSGHEGVFQRRGKSRLPIDELRTRPIPDVFRDVRSVGVARAAEALRTNLQSELRFALRRRA